MFLTWVTNTKPYVTPILFGIVTIAVVYVLLRLAFLIARYKFLLRRSLVEICITPPAFTPRTAAATKQLFMTLHGLHRARALKHKLLRLPVVMSLEVVATKSEGICYRIILDQQWASIVQRSVQSYLSGAKVTVNAFKPDKAENVHIRTYRQSGHYAFPLASQSDVEEHDPIAYLTGVMDGLTSDERITYQLLLTPILSREARSLSARVLRNDFQTKQFGGQGVRATGRVGSLMGQALFGVAELIGDGFHSSAKRPSYNNGYIQTPVPANKPVRQLSSFEQQLLQGVHDKITDPLFHASVRMTVEAPTKAVAIERLASITSALSAYDTVHYQSLRPVQFQLFRRLLAYLFVRRLPATTRSQNIFSAAELANLYHFPLSPLNRSDNIVASLSRTLAPPLSLKQSQNFDVVIGQNSHHGIDTPIGLTEQERERHVYIIGGTGNGKTTMLQYSIVQDMQNGKGLAIVDPHGDMAETMLRHVPPERLDDVIYFNPDDLEYPIGLNLLELTPGLIGKELLREKDLITESVVSVFRKIFSDEDTGGHRIEYVLRNTVQTALTVEGATLFTIFNLLNDPKYRRSVIKSLDNKDLINFWINELGKAGDMQKVKMAAGITAKIGRFLFSASAKQILEQPKSTIDFDDIINSGKILICNFSKGLLGEDTSELFGITLLAKLQLASLRRARLSRTP